MKLEECKDRKVHLTRLAERMGYSEAHISNVVSGKWPANKRFTKLLDLVSIEDVLKDYAKEQLKKS